MVPMGPSEQSAHEAARMNRQRKITTYDYPVHHSRCIFDPTSLPQELQLRGEKNAGQVETLHRNSLCT
jgi:hypothetical protein